MSRKLTKGFYPIAPSIYPSDGTVPTPAFETTYAEGFCERLDDQVFRHTGTPGAVAGVHTRKGPLEENDAEYDPYRTTSMEVDGGTSLTQRVAFAHPSHHHRMTVNTNSGGGVMAGFSESMKGIGTIGKKGDARGNAYFSHDHEYNNATGVTHTTRRNSNSNPTANTTSAYTSAGSSNSNRFGESDVDGVVGDRLWAQSQSMHRHGYTRETEHIRNAALIKTRNNNINNNNIYGDKPVPMNNSNSNVGNNNNNNNNNNINNTLASTSVSVERPPLDGLSEEDSRIYARYKVYKRNFGVF